MSFGGKVAMAVVSPWGRERAHLLPPLPRRALFSLLLVSTVLAPTLVTYVAVAVMISQLCELPVQGIATLILAVSPHPWAVAVLATAPVLAATCVLADMPALGAPSRDGTRAVARSLSFAGSSSREIGAVTGEEHV